MRRDVLTKVFALALSVFFLLSSIGMVSARNNGDILCDQYGYRYRVLSVWDAVPLYEEFVGYENGEYLSVAGDFSSFVYSTTHDRIGVLSRGATGGWVHGEISGDGFFSLPEGTNFVAFCSDRKAKRHV